MRLRPCSRGADMPPSRPEPGSPVIRATGIQVWLGRRTVLSDVDLEVRAGELLALVGPNGAGKSTLLAALSGDIGLTAGTILIHDAPIDSYSPVQLARLRAVLPQRVTLSFPFTGAEVVGMGRAPWAGTHHRAEDDEAVAEAMATLDLEPLAARPFPALSGGEQARVALARVLAQRTGILFLDEPTAALDVRHQELVLTIARHRVSAGAAVVVVLHDLGLAAAYADRIALLIDGRVTADGPPAQVLTKRRLSDAYQHEIDVTAHPHTGTPLVLPVRTRRPHMTNLDAAAALPAHPDVPARPGDPAAGRPGGMAARLRATTNAAHQQAESSEFVTALMAGTLPRAAYTALATQHYFIYQLLEQAGAAMRDDPVAGPFVTDALLRLPAITDDLAFLIGPQWRDTVTPLPATVAYCSRLREVAFTEPEAFIAHHYTRYLGDLSGGALVAAAIRRHYGLIGSLGTRFYEFDGIPKRVQFKREYRERLDALALTPQRFQRLSDEAVRAFDLNRRVFVDLRTAHPEDAASG